MIRVVSTAQVFNSLQDAAPLPSLAAALKPVCRESFRRVDRFIELALLGSGLCATEQTLATDCGLYLGSGLGTMSSIIASQEQLLREREVPTPFNFINTLGNSAGYYVARNLKLTGQNLFISRRGASLAAALTAAWQDLELGVVRQALVGVVEEATLPLEQHRRRQGLAAGTPVAEGSHWLLLEKDADSGRSFTLQHFTDGAEYMATLEKARREGVQIMPAASSGAFHDSWSGAWLTQHLSAGDGAVLLSEGDEVRGWDLFHFGA
jgi:hypothetical protein